MRWKLAPPIVVVIAAFGAATLSAPAGVVRTYETRAYPWLQAVLTPLSNRTAIPLFDVLVIVLVAAVAGGVLVATGQSWRRRTFGPVFRAAWLIGTASAVLYLWFVLAWGYNYRRPGVESMLPGFTAGQATPAALRDLAERAVTGANRLHAIAHAQGFPPPDAVPDALLRSLHRVEHRLGRLRPTWPAVPKTPLTAPYMRAVGVSGMLAPLFLETYLNPDLTGPERPYVLAHEWAHLSGFAPEEDASFVGVVTALGADPASQYSAWLFLVSETAARLPPATRQLVLQPLGEGPRRDQEAIAARLHSRVEWLDRASWVAYDRAIKSQGAGSGVAGYGRVIELLLGSGVLSGEDMRP